MKTRNTLNFAASGNTPSFLWKSLIFCIAVAATVAAHGQGLETFDNSEATASYTNGSFIGEGGITWNYVHARNEGDFPIDGAGLMLRRADEPSSLSATIPGGVGNFSVDTRKAFTANAQRRLELVINGSVVAQFEPDFPDGASDLVIPFEVESINTPGDVELSLRLFGANGNQQLTLDNLAWTGFGGTDPFIGNVVLTAITENTATATASFLEEEGEGFTEYGFVISETLLNDDPLIGGQDVTLIDFSYDELDPPAGEFSTGLTGLSSGTSYSIRAYVIYDDGDSVTYSNSVSVFSTAEPSPGLDGVTDYTQNFSTFVSGATIPVGWSFEGNDTYDGDWGTGFSAGLRGNASVLGYQHTSGTGTFVKILTLQNNTGDVLNAITLSYDGRVARADQGRNPIYTVRVNGVEVPALTYDTNEGDGITKSSAVHGLNVADGDSFTIEWASERGAGEGSSKQIGISNVTVSAGGVSMPPLVDNLRVDPFLLEPVEFFVEAEVITDNGSEITERGFVYAEASLNPDPEIDGDDVIQIVDGSAGEGEFDAFVSGLMPGTTYAIRAYAINGIGTSYTSVLSVTTPLVPPDLGATPYTESFSGYEGGLLPAGWSVFSSSDLTDYGGEWGTGTSAGLRGGELDPGVLGYQHTAATGEVSFTLTLFNDTGDTIENLRVAYTGRVARLDQGRFPEWTVEVDFQPIPALHYSTAAGEDQHLEAIITGLFIPDGWPFTITWISDNVGTGSGSSRQIGISEVEVEALEGLFLSAPEVEPFSDTYLDPISISMFSFDPDTEIRYTLNGENPTSESTLYTEPFMLGDSAELRARAFAVDPESPFQPSPVTTRNYVLPIIVTELADVREPQLGRLYKFDTEIIVSFIDLGSPPFRNQAYLQDDTGGIFVDDPGGFLNAPENLSVGDGLTGLVGTFSVFSDQLQFTPSLSAGTVTSSGNTLEPVIVDLDELFGNFLEYRYRLVEITSATFTNADGETAFGVGGSVQPVTDVSGAGEFYVYFSTNYIGTPIPTGSLNITGITHSRNTGNFISARSLDDFQPADPEPSSFDDYMDGFPGVPVDQRGPADNPSGDGVTNLMKFAFGGSPLISDRSMLPASLEAEIDDERYFAITIHAARDYTWHAEQSMLMDADEAVALIIVTSGTLEPDSWEPAELIPVDGNGDIPAGGTGIYRLTTPIGDSPPTFLRVLVSIPAD